MINFKLYREKKKRMKTRRKTIMKSRKTFPQRKNQRKNNSNLSLRERVNNKPYFSSLKSGKIQDLPDFGDRLYYNALCSIEKKK